MKDYSFYILAAYGFGTVLIGFVIMKITLDYRELENKLARFGDQGKAT